MRTPAYPTLFKSGSPIVGLALATALVIVTADSAQASLFLVFDRTSGSPGTIVQVHTGGEGACVVCPPHMPLYFARAEVADGIRSADDSRLVEVGELIVDVNGNGSGRFTVPEVRNGDYAVITYCRPCAPSSGGRAILPLGPIPPFRVFASPEHQPTRIWPWVLVSILVVLAAASALTFVTPSKAAAPER